VAKPTLLLTGAAGTVAQLAAERLAKRFHIVGVDPRPLPHGTSFPGEFRQIPYTDYEVEEIFRTKPIKYLINLGRIRTGVPVSPNFRFQQNVLGTRNLLKMAAKYGIEKTITISTYHVYGAHQHNHSYLNEDEPLRAVQTFPELADAVEMDHETTTFLWRHPEHVTILLRPALVIGPTLNNTTSKILRSKLCPAILGYDPPLQFLHCQDLISALELALKSKHSGIYNVSGEGVIPFSRAVELAGGVRIPILAPAARLILKLAGDLTPWTAAIPPHLIDYFMYPTLIDDSRFRATFKFEPEFDTVTALQSLRK
jgi:UDP-glucose 4-epimerase